MSGLRQGSWGRLTWLAFGARRQDVSGSPSPRRIFLVLVQHGIRLGEPLGIHHAAHDKSVSAAAAELGKRKHGSSVVTAGRGGALSHAAQVPEPLLLRVDTPEPLLPRQRPLVTPAVVGAAHAGEPSRRDRKLLLWPNTSLGPDRFPVLGRV